MSRRRPRVVDISQAIADALADVLNMPRVRVPVEPGVREYRPRTPLARSKPLRRNKPIRRKTPLARGPRRGRQS